MNMKDSPHWGTYQKWVADHSGCDDPSHWSAFLAGAQAANVESAKLLERQYDLHQKKLQAAAERGAKGLKQPE